MALHTLIDVADNGIELIESPMKCIHRRKDNPGSCLLYTSDAADERSSVDLGGRRIIKKKKKKNITWLVCKEQRYVHY